MQFNSIFGSAQKPNHKNMQDLPPVISKEQKKLNDLIKDINERNIEKNNKTEAIFGQVSAFLQKK